MPFEKGHKINRLKIANKKFGRLKVIRYTRIKNHNTMWLCKCSCGKIKEIVGASLVDGNTKSCGCLGQENRIKSRKMHGMRDHPFYKIWCSMRYRCNNSKYSGYKNYGGRGIKVCKHWSVFLNFKKDMYQGYLEHVRRFKRKNTCIDRVNNDLGYSLKNCKWSTRFEQNSNTRKNHYIEFRKRKLTISQWARRLDVDRATIIYRVFKAKWPLSKALTVKNTRLYDNEILSL